MTFSEGLVTARSRIVFLLGLIVAFGIIIRLETLDLLNPEARPQVWQPQQTTGAPIVYSPNIPHPAIQPLTVEEREAAQIAWRYFERNYQPTGLVNSVDGFPSTTLWDTASYLMALIAAEQLQIISADTFAVRMGVALNSLAVLPLFGDMLPNKVYHTQTLQMVNYQNAPTEKGIGWSAIDQGRFLSPFHILVWDYPQFTPLVRQVLARWKMDKLVHNGKLFGAVYDSTQQIVFLQEGRLGYEEYAARAVSLLGYDVREAQRYDDFLAYVAIEGVEVPTDSRTPEKYYAHNYVVSEPYILDGLEFGWDAISAEFAYRVYQAQEARFQKTGILTAVSEDHLDQAPYFIYNTVFTDGKAWNCITDDGRDASDFRQLSVKAAFGWHALYRTAYTQKLMEAVRSLHDPQGGWYAGLYEKGQKPNKVLCCNTNAVILEALCYQQFGPLVPPGL